MIHVAVDITAYAHNRYGGVARVCAATVIELARYEGLSVTAYWRKGEMPSTALPITVKRFGLIERVFRPTADITHSLCHRMLPVKSRHHVYSVHDAWSLHPNHYQGAAFQRKLGDRLRRDMARADTIVTGSGWTRSELVRLGAVDEERCIVVPDGVTMPPPIQSAEAILSRYRLRPREYVLFVGRLEYRKNLSHVVSAIKGIPALTLACVGEPGYGYEDSVVPELAKMEQDRLTVVSRIADADLSALYANALAALQPSWDEGFGLPVLEAMAHGCPAITSNCGATREVGERAAILADPAAPEQSKQALERLVGDSAFRSELIAAGLSRAREYSWIRYGEALVGLYGRLMSR